MGEINKAKRTVTTQKTTATPTTTTTITPTTPGHSDRQTTTTGTVPTLSEYANTQNQGNVTKKLSSSGLFINDLMKTNNNDAYVNTEKAKFSVVQDAPQALDLSINNVVDLLQKGNVDPKNATANIRAIFNDPVQRKRILGEKSIFNSPEYLNMFANRKVGGSTYEDDAVAKIAQYYATLKPQYDTQYGVTPGRKVTETTTTSMPNGQESVNKVIEAVKGTGDKIKVKTVQ